MLFVGIHFDLFRKRAFSLVEVVLAIGVVSFAILTMVALLPIGLKSEQGSFDETSAVNLMHAVTTDLANTPVTNSSGTINLTSYRYSLPLPSTYTSTIGNTNTFYVNDAQQLVASSSLGTFHVVCVYNPAVTNGITSPLSVLMQVYWPAGATTTNYQGSVETYVTFPKNLP